MVPVMTVRVDLHVHTRRYSPCAEFVEPMDIAHWAVKAGLRGVVITDHDMLWGDEEIAVLRKGFPRIAFYRGIECSAVGCHILLIGIDDIGPLCRGIAVEEAVSFGRAQQAVSILAHPYRDSDPNLLPLGLFDAIEVASTSFSLTDHYRSSRLAERLGKPQVASSDAHALSRIGFASTEFPSLPADERELAAMIRRGSGRPLLPDRLPGY